MFVNDRGIEVLSLDVFDTALTRASGPPQALFLLLGNRLGAKGMIDGTPEVFARRRARAEADVWHREGGLDACVVLEDFYRELVRLFDLDPGTIPALVDEELALEAALLRGNPRVRRLVERHRERGGRTIFVSDTYFDRDFIEQQLRREGLWVEGASVIASSDYEGSKSHGQLFDVALQATKVAPKRMVHAGDNPHSDVVAARRKGLRARPLPDGRLNRYEELLASGMWETGGMSAGLAGASRLVRLHTPAASSREVAIRDVAAGVAAPCLVAYVLWLLRQARRQGLDRLYFVARDGQVMAEVASILIERLGLDLEVAYLYASRASVNLAAMFDLGEEDLAWVERDVPELSPRGVLALLDVAWHDVATAMARLGIEPDAPPGSSDARRALEAVRNDPEVGAQVLERSAERRELVDAYLAQEGLLDGSACALIDFGGVGSQMRALHLLITRAGGKRPRLLLLGMDRPEDAGLRTPPGEPDWLQDTACYLYDHRRNLGVQRRRGFGTCVQMFCAADHGTVTGYRAQGARIVPTLSQERDEDLQTWGLATMRAAITTFTEQMILDTDLVDLDADLHEAATRGIDLFWTTPTRAEASAWGAFPFEGAEVASGVTRPRLAHPYHWRFVVHGLLGGTFPHLGWRHWYEASLVLSSRPVRLTVRLMDVTYRRFARMRHPLGMRVTRTVRQLLGRPQRG